MSNIVVKLIPDIIGDKTYKVSKIRIEELLKEIGLTYEKIEIIELDNIEFIDCGKNLEYIRCPKCYRDALRWWGEVMNISSQTNFVDRNITTPCCNTKMKLEDLEYCLECGFSKFIIQILNPSNQFLEEDIKLIEDEIGIKLRKITKR